MSISIKKMTEKQLRNFKVPWFKTEKGLLSFIRNLLSRKHDYGTCVYAVSLASTATFNYMASKLGITGFQASCADLDILTRTRHLKRFKIINYDDLLYPQYLNSEHFPSYNELIAKNKDWLRKKARKLLKEEKRGLVSRDVWNHWQLLARLKGEK